MSLTAKRGKSSRVGSFLFGLKCGNLIGGCVGHVLRSKLCGGAAEAADIAVRLVDETRFSSTSDKVASMIGLTPQTPSSFSSFSQQPSTFSLKLTISSRLTAFLSFLSRPCLYTTTRKARWFIKSCAPLETEARNCFTIATPKLALLRLPGYRSVS